MKIALIQTNSGEDVAANLHQAGLACERAAAEGARLALLPENVAFMGRGEADKLAVAEAPGCGPIQDWLAATAARLGLYLLAGTVPLRGDDPQRVRAASLLVGPDGELRARYDKIHLFDVDVPREGRIERYRESAHIEPGPPHPVVVDVAGWRLGLSVCYDLRFPELYRALATAGAELLCVPSAFTDRTGSAHWRALLTARAVENLCYVAAPNQCGEHPGGRRTWGHSLVLSPWGDVLAELEHEPGIVLATLERDKLHQLRAAFPCLAHRRLS